MRIIMRPASGRLWMGVKKMKKLFAGLCVAMLFLVSAAPAAEGATVKSEDALAYISLDIENSPGWVAHVKGGYQWNLFKGVGIEVRGAGTDFSRSKDFTKGGGAASVSLGYNFGDRLPLTVGLEFGFGPSGKLDMYSAFNGNTLFSRQKVNIFNLDFTFDYDFKNCTRWTPFVGATVGAAFVSQKGHARLTDASGTEFSGKYDRSRKVNFMTGARAGVKYDVNRRVTLSFYGSYNYMGKISGKSYELTDGVQTYEARTKGLKAHSLAVKAGLKIAF